MNQPPEPRPLPEGEDSFEEVHVTLADGRSIYWPKGDMTRLAPAAVCNVASRMIQLRKAIKADPFDMREVERLIASPISFEKEFLSGDSLTVHNAIKALGIEALPAPSVLPEIELQRMRREAEACGRLLPAQPDSGSKTPITDACTGDCRCNAVGLEESEDACPREEMVKLELTLAEKTTELSESETKLGQFRDTLLAIYGKLGVKADPTEDVPDQVLRLIDEKTAEVERLRKFAQALSDDCREICGTPVGTSTRDGMKNLVSEVTTLREEVSRLREALGIVIRSATPNRRDNPRMFEAWKIGNEALLPAPVEAAGEEEAS